MSAPRTEPPTTLETLFKTHPNFRIDPDKGLLFGDIPLQPIAENHGTPIWVINADILIQRYHRLSSAFQQKKLDVSIHYAMKANDHLAVLNLLAKEGAGVDIVSLGELKRALHVGIDPQKICFSGVGKTREEITLAIEKQIGQINVESREELHLISEIAQELDKKAAICLRINPDVDAGTHHKITTGLAENKFGIAYEQALTVYAEAHQLSHIIPLGFDVHIGSQISSTSPYEKAFLRMVDLIHQARKANMNVSVLDCGGGFGISYYDEKEADPEAIATLMQTVFSGLNIRLSIEPGRWLIGPAGILISQVIRKKENGPDASPFIIINAAMNDLVRPAMYDAWHGILPIQAEIYRRPLKATNIDGPVCESSDIFARNRLLPELKENDFIAILDSGAYGHVMSSSYNARPRIAQFMIKNGKIHQITPRQPIESIWDNEIIPF